MFHDISILSILYNMGEVCYNQSSTKQRETEKERFTVVCMSTLSSKPENRSFCVVVLTSTGEKCTKMHAARAVQHDHFFLFKPIILLLYGVVVS